MSDSTPLIDVYLCSPWPTSSAILHPRTLAGRVTDCRETTSVTYEDEETVGMTDFECTGQLSTHGAKKGAAQKQYTKDIQTL